MDEAGETGADGGAAAGEDAADEADACEASADAERVMMRLKAVRAGGLAPASLADETLPSLESDDEQAAEEKPPGQAEMKAVVW